MSKTQSNIKEPSKFTSGCQSGSLLNDDSVNISDQISTDEKKESDSRKRLDIILQNLRKAMGSKWWDYQDLMYEFITGKLNRSELDEPFDEFRQICSSFGFLHNQFIFCLLCNAYSDSSLSYSNCSQGWSRKKRYKLSKQNAKLLKLKAEIMSLTYHERNRIKSMVKDPRKRPLPKPGVLIETRIARLPKVPVTKDKLNSIFANDIMKGRMIPLFCENHLLPDTAILHERVISIASEQGLLGGLNEYTTTALLCGLEQHLKNIIMKIVSHSSHNRNRSYLNNKCKEKVADISENNIITLAELETCWEIEATALVEPQPATQRLIEMHSTDLQMDDEYERQHYERVMKSKILDEFWEERMQLAVALDEILETRT